MKNIIGVLGMSLALAGCEGGAHVPSKPVPLPQPVEPGGIWRTNPNQIDPPANEEFFALVAEDGRTRIVTMGYYQALVSNSGISYTPFKGSGKYFGGESQDDPYAPYAFEITYQGAVVKRSVMTIDWTGFWTTGRFDLTYDASLYERPSSLEILAGLWTGLDDNGQPWLEVEINADGSFTGMDYWGCTSSGQFAIIDSRYNLYDAFDVTSDCEPDAELFSGLAFLPDPAGATDIRLFVSVDNGAEARRLTMHRN